MSADTANKTFCSVTCDTEWFTRFETGTLDFTIETGIKIPPRLQGKTSRWRTLIEKMKIGASILLPNKKIAGSLKQAFKKAGISCASREMEFGYRVWKGEKLPDEPDTP